MTETPPEPTGEPSVAKTAGSAEAPADRAVRQEPIRPSARRGFGGYVVVALLAFALGAAGMFFGLRYPARGSSGVGSTPSQAAGTAGQAPAADHEGTPGMDMSGDAGGHPTEAKGKTVYISPARQQLIGVRLATVEHRALDTTIRTVGILAYDETRITEIHTKIAGWVERLFVDYVGKTVKRGEPLFTVYSPDLVATQKEYLLALRGAEQLRSSQFAETRTGAESLVAATRERLKLWDISEAQIEELERTGQPQKTLTLYSPFSGVVLERNAFAGQYLRPEMSTFKIADLSTIWVLGQVFEYELKNIRVGQAAQVEFPYGQSTRILKGQVTFIYPEIDPQTRRAKVRIEFRNPGLEFKPQTYVTVILNTPGGHQLAVPKEAVLDNGNKQYAILAHPNGYFEPREIEVGQPVDEYFPLVSGLEAGNRIVTSAQFLVDSETNLQAAMQAMSMSMPGMDMGAGDQKASPKNDPRPKDDPMPGMDIPPAPAKPPGQPDHSQHQAPAKPKGSSEQQQ